MPWNLVPVRTWYSTFGTWPVVSPILSTVSVQTPRFGQLAITEFSAVPSGVISASEREVPRFLNADSRSSTCPP